MTTGRDLEHRLSRMEARNPEKTEAERRTWRALRAMSTPDLKCLEGLLERVESGDPNVALTASEQEWIDETMKRATLAADG